LTKRDGEYRCLGDAEVDHDSMSDRRLGRVEPVVSEQIGHVGGHRLLTHSLTQFLSFPCLASLPLYSSLSYHSSLHYPKFLFPDLCIPLFLSGPQSLQAFIYLPYNLPGPFSFSLFPTSLSLYFPLFPSLAAECIAFTSAHSLCLTTFPSPSVPTLSGPHLLSFPLVLAQHISIAPSPIIFDLSLSPSFSSVSHIYIYNRRTEDICCVSLPSTASFITL
jgi:hypothetical protein